MGMLDREDIPRIIQTLLILLPECPSLMDMKTNHHDFKNLLAKIEELKKKKDYCPYLRILILGSKDLMKIILERINMVTTEIICVEKNPDMYAATKEQVTEYMRVLQTNGNLDISCIDQDYLTFCS